VAHVRSEPKPSGVTVTSLQASAIVVGLVAAGVDADAVFTRAGIPLAELGDPERRFPREAMLTLWKTARQEAKDPAFGLHIAEWVPYGSFGVLEYIARSSATLGEALARVGKYARWLDDVGEVSFVKRGDDVTIVPLLSDAWPIPSDVMEGLLAFTVRMARELCGDPSLLPRAVEVRHAPPPDTREHTRVFGVPVRFNAGRDGITFSESQLALPVPKADPALSAILDRHAQELLKRLPSAGTFAERVRGLLAAELRGGNPELEQVAAKLRISARTLRRRLKDEGTGLTALLDELRRELALRYLEEHAMTLDAIAFELGFGDARAFRRAFKRWTGRAPRDAPKDEKGP
jgi:AraC-like DNA-binding protein